MSEAEEATTIAGPAVPVAPLGKSAGRGAAAFTSSALLMRLLNFASQIVLGAVLLEEDFGLFAIANSVAAFVVVLQDGGLRTLLVQRGEAEYENLEGPAFWLGFAFNLAAAVTLALLAPLAAKLYAEPKLASMLWVISSGIVLNSFGAVSLARLSMQMRFGALSVIEAISGFVRYGGMAVGALAGLGPIAFVAPIPAIALFEGLAAYGFTRRAPWTRRAETSRWPSLLGSSSWLVVSAMAGSALYVGFSMALGLTASTALVGTYFFGYAIVQQSGHLIVSTAERVLLPIFSRLRGEPERQRSAALRTLRAVAVLGLGTAVLLGALFPPVEHLIWGDKWAAAIGVVQVMAICYPLFTLHVVARSVINAWGRFRAHALSVAIAGVTLMIVAATAGAVTTHPSRLGWILGIAMTVVSLAYLAWGLRDLRVTPRELASEILPVTLCGGMALAAGIGADLLVRGALRAPDALGGSFGQRAFHDGMRIAAAGTASAAMFLLSIRLIVPHGLRDCLDVLPNRVGGRARRLLGLGSSA